MSKNRLTPFISVCASLPLLVFSAAYGEPPTTRPAVDRKAIAEAIVRAAETGDATPLASAHQQLANTIAGDRLETALAQTDAAQRQTALQNLAEDLAFEPTSEAPTPEGWPSFTPIGEIELKAYPAYRSAITQRADPLPESLMFWKLFLHIQRNKISMTAPVEMTMDDPADGKMQSMGFMYVSDEIGKLGAEGAVTVVDVPAQLAVSVGLRGEMDKAAIADAARRIDEWLADHVGEYEPAGEYRVMGYNSPSMPPEKKFYEVQRVVARKDK